MSTPTQPSDVPRGVLLLLQSALHGDLLTDVDAMAAALHQAGWETDTHGGSWDHISDPAWSVQSSDHAPNMSLFTHGDHQVLLQYAAALGALIDSGAVGPVQAGDPDPDWVTWSGKEVAISLNVTSSHRLGKHPVPATLQLAVERADTPSDGLAPDPERARQVAREGSPIARWYLAGEDVLPDDVVAVLAADADPAVRAALAANELQRRTTYGEA